MNELMEHRRQIYHLARSFWKAAETEWAQWLSDGDKDMTIIEHIILIQLAQDQQLSISELSELGMIHISTALNTSKKLEQLNYVRLKKSEDDTRVTYVEITEHGKEKLKKVEQYWDFHKDKLMKADFGVECMLGRKVDYHDVQTLIEIYYRKPKKQNEVRGRDLRIKSQ